MLFLVEQNNELLMKTHQARPSSSTPFPEVNVVSTHDYGKNNKTFGRGYECDFGHGQDHDHHRFSNFKRFTTRSGVKMRRN